MQIHTAYLAAALASLLAVYFYVRADRMRRDLESRDRQIERLRLTLDLSEDVGRFGYWQLDTGADHVIWSDFVFAVHGRPKSAGYPGLAEAIAYYHPEDRQMVEDAVSHALHGGEDFEFSARILAESDQEVLVLSRGTCQFGRNGEILGIFGCLVDLTKQTQRTQRSPAA
ncbi:MAG: PAS domain-containing protein [Sphingomonadaceae bacterium]|nr:PAS domain-containing protein [Sphingomonadaceae bacterium]